MDQKLLELTDLYIAQLEQEVGVSNLKLAVRENYELWTMRLFPLLQARKIGCYAYLAELLIKAGYSNATEALVRSYFWDIRQRNKQKSLPPSISQVATVAPPPSPIHTRGVDLPAATPVSLPDSPRIASPSLFKNPQPPVAPFVQIEPVSIEGKEAWQAQWSRLARESETGWTEWNGFDQTIWNLIVSKAEKQGFNVYEIEQRHKYQRVIEDSSEKAYKMEKCLFDKYDYHSMKA